MFGCIIYLLKEPCWFILWIVKFVLWG